MEGYWCLGGKQFNFLKEYTPLGMMGLDGTINEKREKKAGMMDLILLVYRLFLEDLEALEKNCDNLL